MSGGFFNDPIKATGAFLSNPIGIINNDLSKLFQPVTYTPQQQTCINTCFDLHVAQPPNLNFTDKKYLDKEFQSSISYFSCVSDCTKK